MKPFLGFKAQSPISLARPNEEAPAWERAALGLTNQPRSMTLQGIDKRFGTESIAERADVQVRASSLLVCSPEPLTYCICEILRSVHEGSGYLFRGNGLRLYYRGNHKYLPGRQKVSK